MSKNIIEQLQREMLFTTTIDNIISTISSESSDVASSEAMDDLSKDQESVEVYYSKRNKNERSSV